MSTNIAVSSTQYQTPQRGWLASAHGLDTANCLSITVDFSKFTAGTHYPNGYLPSGTVLGKVSATGLYGPYDNTAADGREVAKGVLFSDVYYGGSTSVTVGGALVHHGTVTESRLPFVSGAGAIDAAGKTDLPQITFI